MFPQEPTSMVVGRLLQTSKIALVPHATFIVNPAAGRFRLFARALPAMRDLLKLRGLSCEVVQTKCDDNATHAVVASAAKMSSILFACGGDGTVHAAIQGIAHTGVTFGVIPLGTANALARNLDLPLDPEGALAKLLTYRATAVPLGQIDSCGQNRFFTVMAGCGPDGALVHLFARSSAWKVRFGRLAYYGHAGRLFFTRRWPAFAVHYRRPGCGSWEQTIGVGIMASRIPDLGGIFSRLTKRANIRTPFLHVHVLHPPAQLSLPAWFASSGTGLPNPWLESLDVDELRCLPLDDRPVYAQADAEPIGSLPISLRMLPDALNLLMPAG